MKTQQMVQELKAERVQEELMPAEEPCRIWLKAERVQEPALTAGGVEGKLSSSFELSFNQLQSARIELLAMQAVVTVHTQAGSAPAHSPGGTR